MQTLGQKPALWGSFGDFCNTSEHNTGKGTIYWMWLEATGCHKFLSVELFNK